MKYQSKPMNSSSGSKSLGKPFVGKKIRIFKSFEEAEEAEAMDIAQQSPAERLRETVERILRVYGVTREQLVARHKKLHINIIRATTIDGRIIKNGKIISTSPSPSETQ